MLRAILGDLIKQAVVDAVVNNDAVKEGVDKGGVEKEGFAKAKSVIDKDKLQALFMDQLNALGLVTREEFDAQSQVLARCQVRLEELEQQLQALASSERTDIGGES